MSLPLPDARDIEAIEAWFEEWEKRAYEKTRRIEYAALAIGRRLKDPPLWALAACREYWAAESTSLRRFDDRKPLGFQADDEPLMFAVALWVAAGRTPFKAVEIVLRLQDKDSLTLEADRKRLYRLWQREEKRSTEENRPNRWLRSVLDVLTSHEDLPPNPRLDPMAKQAIENFHRSIDPENG